MMTVQEVKDMFDGKVWLDFSYYNKYQFRYESDQVGEEGLYQITVIVGDGDADCIYRANLDNKEKFYFDHFHEITITKGEDTVFEYVDSF